MTTDLDLELVRELSPGNGGPSEQARERARAALLAQIDSERDPRPRSASRRFKPRLLRVSLGFAGAATFAGVLLAVLGAMRGGVVRPDPAAAQLLRRAAITAEASGGPRELRLGEYWYVHSRETRLGVVLGSTTHPLVIPDARGFEDRQAWIGRGVRSWVNTRVIGGIQFLSRDARESWLRAGRPRQLRQGDFALPADAFDLPYRKLLTLPTNVDTLWQVIKRDAGKGSASWQRHEMLTVIGDLLREDPVPARVRAALYRVAARIPGIQLLGRTRDGIGRPALDVSLNDSFDGQRVELLFDPRTAKLLGERYTVVKPPPAFHVKPGTLTYESTYISSGVVQRIGQHVRPG